MTSIALRHVNHNSSNFWASLLEQIRPRTSFTKGLPSFGRGTSCWLGIPNSSSVLGLNCTRERPVSCRREWFKPRMIASEHKQIKNPCESNVCEKHQKTTKTITRAPTEWDFVEMKISSLFSILKKASCCKMIHSLCCQISDVVTNHVEALLRLQTQQKHNKHKPPSWGGRLLHEHSGQCLRAWKVLFIKEFCFDCLILHVCDSMPFCRAQC